MQFTVRQLFERCFRYKLYYIFKKKICGGTASLVLGLFLHLNFKFSEKTRILSIRAMVLSKKNFFLCMKPGICNFFDKYLDVSFRKKYFMVKKKSCWSFFRLWSFDLHEKTENFSNWNKFWKNQNRQFSSYQLSQALFWKVFKHSFQIKYQKNNIKLILTIFGHLNLKKGDQIRLFSTLFKIAIIFFTGPTCGWIFDML